MPETKRWYLDTVVLSNFTLAGRLDVLIRRYGKRAHLTQEVLGEISDGVAAGYAALRAVEDAVAARDLSSAKPLTVEERPLFGDLLRPLSSGEASCLACAQIRGGIVATDDRAARSACDDRRIPCTGTIGILRACCRDGSLSATEADAALQAMVDAGFYSPVRWLSDLV